jgi:hypothetical protein
MWTVPVSSGEVLGPREARQQLRHHPHVESGLDGRLTLSSVIVMREVDATSSDSA